jgi:hypothetical protein
MEYSELRVAAGRLVILDEIKSCLKKSGANLTEHDLCTVERYLHHAVAIEFTFADRVAKRIVDEKIVLPDSRPLRGYMTKEIIKSDWYSELSRLARSDQMSNFVNAELNSASIIASVRWKSYTFSKVAFLISREHGYSSISTFNTERMLKLIFDHESRIVYDRIVESVNDAVVGAWSRYGWLKRQSAIADNIRMVLNCNKKKVTKALQLFTELMGLGYIVKLDDKPTREFLVEAIAEGVWKRVNKNSSDGDDGGQ